MNQSSSQLEQRILQALTHITPQALAHQLQQILQSQNWHGSLKQVQVQQLCESHQLSPCQLALQLLPVAACYSHAPISHFYVGAVAIAESGNFYFGANQEFESACMPQTVHAEQSAISHAWQHHETRLTDIIVNYTPCGHCRQFMNELRGAEQLKIHLPHSQNNLLHQYLPDAFGPKDLEIEKLLLDYQDHQLLLENHDPVIMAALQATNRSHAPYSRSYHGIAIELENKQIFTGSYAENAAFNPSLPALQVAINHLWLAGHEIAQIQRVVMVEKVGKLCYRYLAQEIINQLQHIRLEYIEVEK